MKDLRNGQLQKDLTSIDEFYTKNPELNIKLKQDMEKYGDTNKECCDKCWLEIVPFGVNTPCMTPDCFCHKTEVAEQLNQCDGCQRGNHGTGLSEISCTKGRYEPQEIDLKKAGKDFAKRFTGVISRLADEDTNILREEDMEKRFNIVFPYGVCHYDNLSKSPDNRVKIFIQSEIFLAIKQEQAKFNQKLEEIQKSIEECSDFADSGDTLKQRILQIIKNKKI